jgi:hypothetical protein
VWGIASWWWLRTVCSQVLRQLGTVLWYRGFGMQSLAELTGVVLCDAQDETLVMQVSFILIGRDSRRG